MLYNTEEQLTEQTNPQMLLLLLTGNKQEDSVAPQTFPQSLSIFLSWDNSQDADGTRLSFSVFPQMILRLNRLIDRSIMSAVNLLKQICSSD